MPAIFESGGGFQVGDGNLLEITMYQRGSPATYAAGGVLTIQDLSCGAVYASQSAGFLCPSGAQLDAMIPNARVGTTFDFNLVPIPSTAQVQLVFSTIPPGITPFGQFNATNPGIAETVQFRKTGVGTWNVLRVS